MNHLHAVRILLPLTLLTLNACTTLSEAECRHGDWVDIGFRDGRSGYPPDRINEHVQACAKFGAQPDRERYLSGRRQGLEQYCTRHNGLQVGQSGGAYRNVCSADSEAQFLEGYKLGSALYEARSRVSSIKYAISRLEKDLQSEEMGDKERRDAERRRLALERELGAAQNELQRLEWEANSF